jgi:alcohol dehydrogenase (cytochrome c)
MKNIFLATFFIAIMSAQGPLDPAVLTKPLSDSWPTYSGDYSGKRYSSLTQINQSNVKNLTLGWVSRVASGSGGGGRGATPTIVGGVAQTESTAGGGGGTNIRAAILEVNGILYFSTPDNAWAMDARDGHELWHFYWRTKGGTHIGNRGLGMWGNWLYMETPDDYLPRRKDWKRALAQRNRRFQFAILLDHGSHCHRQSHSGRHWRRSG